MPALRPFYFFLILTIGLTACSADKSEAEANQDDKAEQLPKVDASKFRKFQGEGFTIQLLKEMSWNRASGMTLLDADHLSKQYHVTIQSYPISYFKNDSQFPKDSKKQLKWFATAEGNALKGKLLNVKFEEMTETLVNKRKCFKQTIHGKAYGFPLRKTFFLRYYETDNSLIKISAWTTSEHAEGYEKLAQYMGMTFKAK